MSKKIKAEIASLKAIGCCDKELLIYPFIDETEKEEKFDMEKSIKELKSLLSTEWVSQKTKQKIWGQSQLPSYQIPKYEHKKFKYKSSSWDSNFFSSYYTPLEEENPYERREEAVSWGTAYILEKYPSLVDVYADYPSGQHYRVKCPECQTVFPVQSKENLKVWRYPAHPALPHNHDCKTSGLYIGSTMTTCSSCGEEVGAQIEGKVCKLSRHLDPVTKKICAGSKTLKPFHGNK